MLSTNKTIMFLVCQISINIEKTDNISWEIYLMILGLFEVIDKKIGSRF